MIGCGSNKELSEEYFSDGQLMSQGFTVAGLKQGDWIYFTNEGDTSEIHGFEKDSLRLKKIFIDGKLFYSEQILNGVPHGELIMYHENGNIKSIGKAVNGIENGEYKGYYENGELYVDGAVNDGDLVGEFKQYHLNGQIAVHSKNIGNSIRSVYDSMGNLTYKWRYKNNQIVDTLFFTP